MSPDEYLAKARRALASARLLLADGDPEGACNRAYYGMFDAAHAALSAVAPDLNPKRLCHAPSGLDFLAPPTQGVALGWYV